MGVIAYRLAIGGTVSPRHIGPWSCVQNKAAQYGKARLGLARTLARKATVVGNEEDRGTWQSRAQGGCVTPRLLEKTEGGDTNPNGTLCGAG